MIRTAGLVQGLAFVLLLPGLRADAFNRHLLNGFDLGGAAIPEAAFWFAGIAFHPHTAVFKAR